MLRKHSGQLFSFAVVANFWNVYHRAFEHVEHVTPALNVLNFAWMFNIVLLPFSTALVGSQPTSQLLLLLYVGPMALCGLLMSAITLLITRGEGTRQPAQLSARQGGGLAGEFGAVRRGAAAGARAAPRSASPRCC